MTEILALLVILVFATASFFFALAETAVFSLSKWQVKSLAGKEGVRGRLVASLLGEPQDLLATMVLGNMVATAAILATVLWMALNNHRHLGWISSALFVFLLMGCEVLPKTMAVRNPELWALRVARLLRLAVVVSRPFCRVAQKIDSILIGRIMARNHQPQTKLTDADYQELLELAFQHGTLGQSEKEMILQIIQLDRRTVKEVMKPRSQMSAIPDDLSVEDMIAAARKFKHRRVPMYDETPDTIVGILDTRALLLDPQIDLSEAVEFPSFVPETINLLQLLKSLQRQQRGLAVVLDEFGGTGGIVTTEDILEEMIGKIRPEVASEGLVMQSLGRGRWRVSGELRLDDFRREYPGLDDSVEAETMGGLLSELLDVVPAAGESAVYRGLKLTAQSTDERRIKELLIEVQK